MRKETTKNAMKEENQQHVFLYTYISKQMEAATRSTRASFEGSLPKNRLAGLGAIRAKEMVEGLGFKVSLNSLEGNAEGFIDLGVRV